MCWNKRNGKLPSPIGSGGPILLPGIFAPDHPLSIGFNLPYLNVPIVSLSCISLFSRSGSSGNCCCWTSSLPLMIGADKPGHTMFALPTPIICPLFRSLMFFFETVLPLPLFLPALLTDVMPFHNESAGTEIIIIIVQVKSRLKKERKLVELIYFNCWWKICKV